MRQAGLKPKSHNSGVYWIRASSSPSGGKSEPKSQKDDSQDIVDKIVAYCIVAVIVVWYCVS